MGKMSDVPSLFLVFIAGLLSFLSPCVLPLIPSYLGILGGVGLSGKTEIRFEPHRNRYKPRLVFTAAGFTLGFSVVFILLGILVSATFSLMGGVLTYINRAAGIIIIILGFHVLFDFLSFLNYEKRPFFQNRMRRKLSVRNMAGAFVAGAAFGTGWTPCIGPILTAILLMASQSGQTTRAMFYLSVYSAGLALPFILAALFFDGFLKQTARLRSRLLVVKRFSGALLIVIGIMILSGRYSALNSLIQKNIFSYIDWAENAALPFRVLGNWLAWLQKF